MAENPYTNFTNWTCTGTMEYSPYSCVYGYYYYSNSNTIVYTINFYAKNGTYIEQKSISFLSSRTSYWVRPGDNNTYGAWTQDGYDYSPTSANIVLATRTITGYTVKWNTQQNGLGTSYNIGQTINIGSNFNLYEITTPISYKANYAANNGSSTPTQATVNYDATYTLPAAISRTGYTFAGWKTGAESNRAASSSFTWNYTADTTFTAQWTANSYKANYAANNGSSTPTQATVNYDATYTLPAAISRTGYTFAGWKTGAESNRAASSSFTWNYTADTTFTAQWTVNSYTLTYNLDGGTIANNPTTVSVTYDASYDLKIPAKTNYTFNGWYSDSNKATLILTTGTWQLTSVNNIYAKFTINGYDLTYNTNGIGGTGKTYSTVIVGTTPTIPIPKAVGYTFNGWYDAATGGNKKINSDGTGYLVAYTMPAATTSNYAQWTVKSDVRLSYLENTYGNIIAGNTKISISEYQSSISKAASSITALKTDFIGKGPNL